MSFKMQRNIRRQTYVRLIADIQHELAKALYEEHRSRGLTKANIARMLGKNKAFVTRKLTGTSNMTLETFADLSYALGREPSVTLSRHYTRPGDNIASSDTTYVSSEGEVKITGNVKQESVTSEGTVDNG